MAVHPGPAKGIVVANNAMPRGITEVSINQPIRQLYAGHKAAAELRRKLNRIAADIPAIFAPVENARVTELVADIRSQLEDHSLAIAGLIQSEYGSVGNGRQAKSCGANTDGGGGFQPGNSCAAGGSGGGSSSSGGRGSGESGTDGVGRSSKDYPKARPEGKDTQTQHTNASGEWTPERKKLHKSIVSRALQGKSPVDEPVGYIMGGGPAAGKSSALRDGGVEVSENTVHIDSDEVKSQLPEYREMTEAGDSKAAAFAHEESSEVSKSIQKEASRGGYNTLLDGTGDGSIESLERKVAVMRNAGQKVKAHYVTVDTETAVQRAMSRAERTGRLVPEAFIRENHAAVSRVAPEAVKRGLFDEFTLWDTNDGTKQVATARGSDLVIHDQAAWDSFVAKGGQ